jgi:putative ATP-dependent endonuclease of OLD family
VRVEFPELAKEDSAKSGVAMCFGQMVIRKQGEVPYCRIRLEGTWRQGSTAEGEVEQVLWWVVTGNKEVKPTDKLRMSPLDRAKIQVHYVPATRDAVRQIRQASGSILHSILRAVRWSKEVKKAVEDASTTIQNAFAKERGVVELQDALASTWKELQTDPEYTDVRLSPVAKRLEDLVKQFDAGFLPGAVGEEEAVDRLSDGLKSLLYFSLVAAAFDIRSTAEAGEKAPFEVEDLKAPLLTLFAVEEPENHVAPHHLGRIMSVLRRLAGDEHGQVVLTSHSPSILGRVEPEEIRHFRTDVKSRCTVSNQLTLPTDKGDYQYVREAVRAFPELYFAKAVVLGEGDSEEVVLPRLGQALSMPLDRSLVALVPLGGRHVNHFWRLLYDLEIPFVTLLDLDLEREGGGWGRIKYALAQLLERGYEEKDVLKTEDGEVFTKNELDKLHLRPVKDRKELAAWIKHLRVFDVYYSGPLDLDFLMLKAFPEAYKATADEGPRIPSDKAKHAVARTTVTAAVLSDAACDTAVYLDEEKELFFWYRYLFSNRSKPATHIEALTTIDDKALAESTPPVLLKLFKAVKALLEPAKEAEGAKSA